MADIKQQFEQLLMDFTKAQSLINDLIDTRSKLETQFQENKMVHDEFEHMDENTKIYKMMGPALMPQDYSEAKSNVEKRMEYIQGEIKRAEEKLEQAQKDMETKRNKLLEIREKLGA